MTGSGARVIRYATSGLLNTFLGLAVIIVLQSGVGLSSYVANAGGYLAGISSGFLLNRRWTFEHRGAVGQALWLYVVSFVACYVLNLSVLWMALRVFHWPAIAAQIAAIATYSVAFYFACKVIVFAPPGTSTR